MTWRLKDIGIKAKSKTPNGEKGSKMSKAITARPGTAAFKKQQKQYQRLQKIRKKNPGKFKAQGAALKAVKRGRTFA